jgi:hypothetical protein
MALQNLQQYGCQTGNRLKEKSHDLNRNHDISTDTEITNIRQVQPKTLPKNSNFSSCLQNIKLKNNTT